MKWSKLYPTDWQREFGQEFDDLLAQRPMSMRDRWDVVVHAFEARLSRLTTAWPTLLAWTVVATLNVFAKEDQWAAGGLVLLCCLLTTLTPRDWWKSAILLFSAIPISSLYFYQLPHIHHEPLYKTAVALIPPRLSDQFSGC